MQFSTNCDHAKLKLKKYNKIIKVEKWRGSPLGGISLEQLGMIQQQVGQDGGDVGGAFMVFFLTGVFL